MRESNPMTLEPETLALLAGLPGEDLVIRGLEDLGRGESASIEALLVLMAKPRMMAGGFPRLEELTGPPTPDLELRLYRRLGEVGDENPYGTYNSLKTRLSSFLSALEARGHREREANR